MMKKTVNLTSLIKAKNDLELFIKVDQMKRLKKLFDPTFDIKDTNSKIASKEDQLIIIKEAIDTGNATIVEDNKTIHYFIYLLSKYNREKSDLNTLLNKLNTEEFLSNNESIKKTLLEEIQGLDDLMKKESDKKKKAEYLSTKNKLKRSLSKVSLTSKSHISELETDISKRLQDLELIISQTKDKLTKYNSETSVENVEINDGFEIIVK